MLTTIPVDFDFHYPRSGRTAFEAFAEALAKSMPALPRIISDPIFTNRDMRRAPYASLDAIDDEEPQIIYLCNIVMHSAVLVIGDCTRELTAETMTYDSLASLRAKPNVRGYDVGDDCDLVQSCLFDESTLVISNIANWWLRDEEHGEPNQGIFEILDSVESNLGQAFACHILDYPKFFEHAICEEQAYFIPDPGRLNLKTCLKYYAKESLTQYLIKQRVPFATIGDCHMDDDIVVSYFGDVWRLPAEPTAFIR